MEGGLPICDRRSEACLELGSICRRFIGGIVVLQKGTGRAGRAVASTLERYAAAGFKVVSS